MALKKKKKKVDLSAVKKTVSSIFKRAEDISGIRKPASTKKSPRRKKK